MTKERRKLVTILAAVAVTVFATQMVFIWYSPSDLVNMIGVQNAYLIAFLVAACGGLNSITSSLLYATVITFAAGGASPWLLGLSAGVGIGLGDTLVFILLHTGVRVVELSDSTLTRWLFKLRGYLTRFPRRLQYTVVYVYLSFSPLPSDVVLLLLASARFPYKVVIPMLFMSGITLATLAALFGEYLIGWF